jgi:hypothetical protein
MAVTPVQPKTREQMQPTLGSDYPNRQTATPERTVEERSRSTVTAAHTAAKPLDNACRVRTTLEYQEQCLKPVDLPGRA